MAIAKCDCKNAFQDARYGPGMRVHNIMKNAKADATAKMGRCTVCSTERALKGDA